MSLHLINIRKKDWRNGLINFIQKRKGLLLGIVGAIIIDTVWIWSDEYHSGKMSVPISITDTIPAKKYTKTATWDLGFIQGKTDSLFLYFRQYGGSALSKDDFNNALMQYIGVIQRAYLVAKIDSVLIK